MGVRPSIVDDLEETGFIGPGWYSTADMARIFGVTTAAFTGYAQPWPRDLKRKVGAVNFWHARRCIDCYGQIKYGGEISGKSKLDSIKAQLAELDLLERRHRLLSRDTLRDGLAKLAADLREAGRNLETLHGADVAKPLYTLIEEFGETLVRVDPGEIETGGIEVEEPDEEAEE